MSSDDDDAVDIISLNKMYDTKKKNGLLYKKAMREKLMDHNIFFVKKNSKSIIWEVGGKLQWFKEADELKYFKGCGYDK